MHVQKLLGLIVLALVAFGCGGAVVTNPTNPTGAHIFVVDSGNDRLVRMDDMTGTNWATLGTPGAGMLQFQNPTDVAFDSTNHIYVVDSGNNRIVRMNDFTGAGWTTFGFTGSGINQFNNPTKLALDSAGRIYVVDSDNNRIVRIDDMTGANWVTFGTLGSLVNQFNTPTGIAIDNTDRIYVSDFANHRIARFTDMTGTNWTSFGIPGNGVGQFTSAVDISLDTLGNMLVVDRAGRVIRTNVMSQTGWIEILISTPQAATTDQFNQVYVVDQLNHQLTRYDSISGANPVQLGALGGGVNQFDNPSAVVVTQ